MSDSDSSETEQTKSDFRQSPLTRRKDSNEDEFEPSPKRKKYSTSKYVHLLERLFPEQKTQVISLTT
jgi:hypothetical protein